jgi:excisionase family DNA binding protein
MKNYKRQKETPAILTTRILRKKNDEKKARADGEFTMTEAASELGIHRDTLKRWIKEGKVPDVRRNEMNSYRMFTRDDIDHIKTAMRQRKGPTTTGENERRRV